jgi:hypothetical protein
MSRPSRFLALIAVATLVPGSTFVLGQVEKAAGPPPTAAAQPAPKAGSKVAAKERLNAKGEKEKEVVKKRAVMKAVALQPARVLAAPAAMLDAQAAQYVQHFRPMFRVEYYFIRNCCDLTRDQRKQLALLVEKATRAAARNFVEAQQKMMRGGWRPGMDYPDPHKLMEEELSKSASSLLSPEQQTRLKQELEKRSTSRKQMFIDNIVSKLDQDLVLNTQQRGKLVEALSANWKDAWGSSLDMLQNMENMFPNIPDQVVAPILSENQKAVWRRIPKNQNVFWGFSFGGMMMQDDPLDDPELVDAEKEAQAKDQKRPR